MTKRPLPEIVFLPEPPPRDPSEVRRWARTAIGAAADTTLDLARRELLGKLADEDFVPPLSWQQSAWVLNDEARGIATQDQPPGFVTDRRADLMVDIASFAKEFFDLEPPERLARWQALRDRATDPAMIARLELLRGGMAIKDEPWEVDSPLFHRIRQCIRETFVCTLTQQPNRWRRFVADMKETRDEVYRAVQLLELHCPEWIELGADLFHAIRDKYPTLGIHVDTSSSPFNRLSSNWLGEVPRGELQVPRRDTQARQKRTVEREGTNWRIFIPFFFVPFITIIIGLSRPSSSPRYPTYTAPGNPSAIPQVPDFSNPANRTFQLPTNADGQIEIETSRGMVNDDPQAREALAKVLGIPVEKLKVKPKSGRSRDP